MNICLVFSPNLSFSATSEKIVTKPISCRYGQLNRSIVSRGKLLHSSGSDSYAGFAPSLDAFISWAKEMDFRMEQAEKEAEREKDKKEKSIKLRKRIQVQFFSIENDPGKFCNRFQSIAL